MKQFKFPYVWLLLSLPCLLSILSCDKNDDLVKTRENGRPSSVKRNDNTQVYFYYRGNMLSRIKEEKGSVYDFKYEGEVLSGISVSPEDKRVMDGHGWTGFTKEGNIITIKSTYEPDFGLSVIKELELDENNVPVKITDKGVYETGETNPELVREGNYYTLFSFDPSTRNLLQQKTYDITSSELISSYEYEYDRSYGMMSKVDLPLWFIAYWLHTGKSGYWDPVSNLFFNYSNNLRKVTVFDSAADPQNYVINYNYQYNRGEYPFFMENNIHEGNMLSITY